MGHSMPSSFLLYQLLILDLSKGGPTFFQIFPTPILKIRDKFEAPQETSVCIRPWWNDPKQLINDRTKQNHENDEKKKAKKFGVLFRRWIIHPYNRQRRVVVVVHHFVVPTLMIAAFAHHFFLKKNIIPMKRGIQWQSYE